MYGTESLAKLTNAPLESVFFFFFFFFHVPFISLHFQHSRYVHKYLSRYLILHQAQASLFNPFF